VESSLITINTSTASRAAARAHEILQLDKPPVTPGVVLETLGLTQRLIPDFDLARLDFAQRRTFTKVRALLDPAERAVYLSPRLASPQVSWAVYHETGHAFIETHVDMLYLDTTHTLSPKALALMEKEANEFAGHLQFFGDRFAANARDLQEFGVRTVLTLASIYNTSLESTFRRYVETSAHSCCCLVFEIVDTLRGTPQSLKLRYMVKSNQKNYWDFPWGFSTVLPDEDPLVQLLQSGQLANGEVVVQTSYNQERKATTLLEIFSNSYSVFVLARALSL
jgi:hypothetical protein